MIWTKEEDRTLADTSVDYDQLQKFLPHRTKRAIWSRASKLGHNRDLAIIRKVNSDNQRREEWTSLLEDEEFCEIIDGEVLGDGCIFKKKSTNRDCYEYSFIAGSIHEEYAQYLHDKIAIKLKSRARISTVPPKYRENFGWSKKFYSVRFSSVVFKEFYERWYPNGSIKHTIPDDINLTPVICLHWYLGDGSLDSRCKAHMFDLSLHTENFKKDSIEKLADFLKKILNIKVSISRSKRKYYKLRIHGNDARSFLEYIGKAPVRALAYKWVDWKPKRKGGTKWQGVLDFTDLASLISVSDCRSKTGQKR